MGSAGHLALKLGQNADVLPLHHAVGPAVPVHAGRKVQAGHHLVRGVDVVHAVPRSQHMARANQCSSALQRPAKPCEPREACAHLPRPLAPQWLEPRLDTDLCMEGWSDAPSGVVHLRSPSMHPARCVQVGAALGVYLWRLAACIRSEASPAKLNAQECVHSGTGCGCGHGLVSAILLSCHLE